MKNMIINFFKEYLLEDVSQIRVIKSNVALTSKNTLSLGYYDPTDWGVVHISCDIEGLKEELVIVHELVHLIQYERNKSYCIHDVGVPMHRLCDFNNACINYYSRIHEVDARIVEAMYISYIYGMNGFITYVPYIYEGCEKGILDNNVESLISSMPETKEREYLLQVLEEQEVS